jgi:hypothetical protein
LHQEELHDLNKIDDGFLRMSIFHLQPWTRQKPYYFLIDGLEDILEEESHTREAILEMLPFGRTGFRFLLSGDLRHLSSLVPKGVQAKSLPLATFTLDETIKYLRDLTDDQEAMEEIRRTCKGTPGLLASVRRIVHSGITLQQLLGDLPSKLPQLFEIEWKTINANDEHLCLLLAILAHSLEKHTIKDLARITQISEERVRALLQDVGFVVITPPHDDVYFVSEAFRKFAADHLTSFKAAVTTYLIDDLQRNLDTNEAFTYLPGYLAQAGRYEDLLAYLSPDDYFMKIVERNQSLDPVRLRSDLGINTALQLHRDEDLIRFSIQRATIDDFDRAEVWRSEVEARMALHDYGAALALAQRTELKEDRLHLLAVIAKAKREQKLQLEPELLEQMRHLYTQINPTLLQGEKAIGIAADLIYSLPEMAIELVEKATNTDTNSSARDWAYTKLTFAAFGSDREDRELFQMIDELESIQSRIENPAARHLSRVVSVLYRESSAQEVIAEVSTFDATDRLNLLRLWASANRTRKDAIEVVDAALRLMIQTTDYSPNARVLRQFATPLAYSRDIPKVRQLVGIFDSQKDVVGGLGPTDEYVRLQLLLARAESKYGDDFETVRNRFIEIYFYINDIDDLAVRTQCMARFAALLLRVDPQKTLETHDRIHTEVQNDLQAYIKQLLEATSDHYRATQGILRALSKTHSDQALRLALALNVEPRRDLALVDVITSTLQGSLTSIDWDFIAQALGQITSQDLVDKSLLSMMNELYDAPSIDEQTLSRFLPFLNRMGDIQDAEVRCRVCSLAHVLLKRHDVSGQYKSFASRLLGQVNTAWEAIDESWNKVNAGFELVKVLADTSQEMAKATLDSTESLKDDILLEIPTVAATYLSCLRLAIRASCGLLTRDLLDESDKERLADFIDRVPSLGERAELWADLAMRNHLYQHSEGCKRIVNEHVKPLLDDMQVTNTGKYYETLSTVAPALYCAHSLTALEQVATLPQPYRDAAYAQICFFIIQKVPPSEPFGALWWHDYKLTYNEVVELCNLLMYMEVDGTISDVIDSIANSVIAGRQRSGFSRSQQQEIAKRLSNIVHAKFPNHRFIQHDGYAIIARAHIARIEKAAKEVWSALLDEARKIPNLADKALVLSTLAIFLPRESLPHREILKEAGEVIKTIPVHLEKMEKYQYLASRALDTDSSLSKQYIEAAMACTSNEDEQDIRKSQRKLIDLAYRIDPDFAALMASRLDDDPARDEVRQRIRILEARRKLEDIQHTTSENFSVEDYAQAARISLGALNAKRINTVPIDHTRDFIVAAAKRPLHQTYPIFVWAIENANRRYASTDQAKIYLRPIFRSTLLGVELAGKMAMRSSAQVRRAMDNVTQLTEIPSIIIPAGNREMALQVLLNWFEQKVRDYLIICDPFFGPPDLEVLKLLDAVNPECKVQILTSKKHQLSLGLPQPWEDVYRDYWRLRVSDQQPPSTEIVVVGTQRGHESPVHDRWWLTVEGGLRVGTSFNSLGITKTSEISWLSPTEAQSREGEIGQYLHRPFKQEHEGERLFYTAFNL